MKKTLSFFLTLFLLVSIIAYAVGEAQDSVATSDKQEPAETDLLDGINAYNILLMGASDTDFSRQVKKPYTLTHILICIDPETCMLKFVTFPYNLVVDTKNGKSVKSEQMQFVCHRLGGDGVVATLEENFGIHIDYWVIMNMAGVSDIVNAIGGIDIDLNDLSINDIAEYVHHIVGEAWTEVIQAGLQKLSGIQVAGYFFNTMYNKPTAEEEEIRFREHHSNIIQAVVKAVQLLQLQGEDLAVIAENTSTRFATSIPAEAWLPIANSAVYCSAGEPQFLHVPQIIKVEERWNIVYDRETDVMTVQQFAENRI